MDKTKRYRKPTKDEEIAAWRALAWETNLHRTITMDHTKVVSCLKRMDAYVGAHASANGERSERDINRNVQEAFWVHIAQKPEDGLLKR